jgi:starvation-inducible DNA-binding protein
MSTSTLTKATTRGPSSNGSPLAATKNQMPVATRAQVAELLNQRLADCIDLGTQCAHAHWNVKGPSFIALHRMFDEIGGDVRGYADLIAERIVQLGGMAEGTARVVATRSQLMVYPLVIQRQEDHVAAMSDVLAQFGRTVRIAVEEMVELKDSATADIMTEILRGVDKWLWFVEAHGPVAIPAHAQLPPPAAPAARREQITPRAGVRVTERVGVRHS